MGNTCALTGHRRLPANFDKVALYEALEAMIIRGCDRFLCGMARGFDLEALECLTRLRKKYPIALVACIPYRGQESGFPEREKEKYRALLKQCDERVYLSGEYSQGCLLARDRYMVDRADVLLAYCTRKTGGTAYTVRYAAEKGVAVENLAHGQKI